MTHIFLAFVLTSFVGSLLTLLLCLIKPFTQKFFSPAWNYYIWLLVLLVMMIPIRFPTEMFHPPVQIDEPYISNQLTQPLEENMQETPVIMVEQDAMIQIPTPHRSSFLDYVRIFWKYVSMWVGIIWISIAGVMFLFKTFGYCLFIHRMKMNSEPFLCSSITNYTKRKLTVRKRSAISSPLLVGMIHPTLILPDISLEDQELHNILKHEITHLHRNDILYKWFANIIKCIHWFNPTVYYIVNQINLECEIHCDSLVVKGMTSDEKTYYAETILRLLSKQSDKRYAFTTGMSGTLKNLKQRFHSIMRNQTTGFINRLFSVILAIVIITTALFSSGVMAKELLPHNKPDSSLFVCEIRDHGKLIYLNHAPIYQSETVYLPLVETFQKIGVMEHEKSNIVLEKKTVNIFAVESKEHANYDNQGNHTDDIVHDLYYQYELKIGKPMLIIYSDQNPQNTFKETKIMEQVPIVKDNVIYVPYEYLEVMVNQAMQYHFITLWGTPENTTENTFYWPTEHKNISASFGKKIHPITGKEVNHTGIDIIEEKGSPVVSSISGEVTETGFDDEFGNYIRIENREGISVYYGHLSSINVKKGESVEQKTVIGSVGDSGLATGAFLHFEIMIQDKYQDPQSFFEDITLHNKNIDSKEYIKIAENYLSRRNIRVTNGKMISFSGNHEECSLTYSAEDKIYEFIIKRTEGTPEDIIEITSFREVPYSLFGEISLRDLNNHSIIPSDNKYYVEKSFTAFVGLNAQLPDFDGRIPNCVRAFFEPADVSMHSKKREVGVSKGPYKNIPIPINIQLNPDETMGHLYFVLEYSDEYTPKSEVSDRMIVEVKETTQSNNPTISNQSENFSKPIKSNTISNQKDIVLSYLSLGEDTTLSEMKRYLQSDRITMSLETTIDLKRNYTSGSIQKNNLSYIETKNVLCDNNGNITFYFENDASGYIDLVFTNTITKEIVAEYGLVPDSTKSYSFMGFQ